MSYILIPIPEILNPKPVLQSLAGDSPSLACLLRPWLSVEQRPSTLAMLRKLRTLAVSIASREHWQGGTVREVLQVAEHLRELSLTGTGLYFAPWSCTARKVLTTLVVNLNCLTSSRPAQSTMLPFSAVNHSSFATLSHLTLNVHYKVQVPNPSHPSPVAADNIYLGFCDVPSGYLNGLITLILDISLKGYGILVEADHGMGPRWVDLNDKLTVPGTFPQLEKVHITVRMLSDASFSTLRLVSPNCLKRCHSARDIDYAKRFAGLVRPQFRGLEKLSLTKGIDFALKMYFIYD